MFKTKCVTFGCRFEICFYLKYLCITQKNFLCLINTGSIFSTVYVPLLKRHQFFCSLQLGWHLRTKDLNKLSVVPFRRKYFSFIYLQHCVV